MQTRKPSVSARAAAVLTALVAGGIALDAQLTPIKTWNCPPTFIVDDRGIADIADGSNGVVRTVKAITSTAAWNGAGAGKIVKAAQGSVAAFALGDGIPMINFQDPLGVCTGSCIAAILTGAPVEREPGSGSYRFADADIVINSAASAWTSAGEDSSALTCFNELYVESVAVREVGRALGLGSSSTAGATMHPSLSVCDNSKATTEANDELRIRTNYGTSPCPTCEGYTEYLSVGGSDVQPCGGSFSAAAGTHGGWITGTLNSNFDLYLDRWNGFFWSNVASSANAGSTESISYAGTAGTYRYRVTSASGADGTYHFWIDRP